MLWKMGKMLTLGDLAGLLFHSWQKSPHKVWEALTLGEDVIA